MSDILDKPTLPCGLCSVPTMFGAMRHLKGEMVCPGCYVTYHTEPEEAGENAMCAGCDSYVPVDCLTPHGGKTYCPLCVDMIHSVMPPVSVFDEEKDRS